MLETLSALVLAFLGIVVLLNLAKGTLGSWFRSKFLGQAV